MRPRRLTLTADGQYVVVGFTSTAEDNEYDIDGTLGVIDLQELTLTEHTPEGWDDDRNGGHEVALPDGTVFVTFGFPGNNTQPGMALFDPATGAFTPGTDTARSREAWLSPDGTTLYVLQGDNELAGQNLVTLDLEMDPVEVNGQSSTPLGALFSQYGHGIGFTPF